jgi:hypothetical protein
VSIELLNTEREVVCAIAQLPMPSSYDNFCTLQPLMFSDTCQRAGADDFPDRGLIWWRLPQTTQPSSVRPGKVIAVCVEPARKQEPGKDRYQVRSGTTRELHDAGFYELLRIEDRKVRSASDLLRSRLFVLRHIPSPLVFVEWCKILFGPFRTEDVECEPAQALYRFSLRPLRPDKQVHRLDALRSDAYRKTAWQSLSLRFSDSSRVSGEQDLRFHSECVLLKKDLLDNELMNAETTRLETDSELLQRIAVEVLGFSRKRKQELRTTLDELQTQLAASASAEAGSGLAAISRIRDAEGVNPEVADAVVEALLTCGALAGRITQRVEDRIAEEVDRIAFEARARSKQFEDAAAQAELDYKNRTNELAVLESQARQLLVQQQEKLDSWQKDLEVKDTLLQQVLIPLTAQIKSSSADVLQEVLRIQCLFPDLTGTGKRRYAKMKTLPQASRSVHPVVHKVWTEHTFLEQRLHPILRSWHVVDSEAESRNLLACFVGTRCILLPEINAAAAIAESCGAAFDVYHVEPDWLNFQSLWDRGLRRFWLDAINRPDRLFFATVSGVNRSPSAAWAQPILLHCDLINTRARKHGPTVWPENLRVAFTWDPLSQVTFELDASFRCACSAWCGRPGSDNAHIPNPADGPLSASTWRDWVNESRTLGASLALPPIERPLRASWRRTAWADLQRISGFLRRFGLEDEKAVHVARKLRLEFPQEVAIPDEQQG